VVTTTSACDGSIRKGGKRISLSRGHSDHGADDRSEPSSTGKKNICGHVCSHGSPMTRREQERAWSVRSWLGDGSEHSVNSAAQPADDMLMTVSNKCATGSERRYPTAPCSLTRHVNVSSSHMLISKRDLVSPAPPPPIQFLLTNGHQPQ